jgi:hypothetical protein
MTKAPPKFLFNPYTDVVGVTADTYVVRRKRKTVAANFLSNATAAIELPSLSTNAVSFETLSRTAKKALIVGVTAGSLSTGPFADSKSREVGRLFPSASTLSRDVATERVLDAVTYMKQVLAGLGYHVKRTYVTVDGSTVFHSENPNVAVDVYPSGNVVVIVRKGDIRYYHECSTENTEDIRAALSEESWS